MFETAQIQLNNKLQELMEQQTLRQFVMFIVTAAAIVTGVVQFAVRSWQENDMTTKLKNATYKTLTVVYNTSHNLAMMIEENEDMRIAAQSQAQSWNRPLFAHKDPRSCIVTSVQTNRMTFVQGLIASGYEFDDENFDACWVRTDTQGFVHLYQEGEDENEWNYVKMSEDMDVISEKTFVLN